MRRGVEQLDQLLTTFALGAVTTSTCVLMALGGLGLERLAPAAETFDWLKATSGGYFVRLSHEGDPRPFDSWVPEPPEHEVRGIVTEVRVDTMTEPLASPVIYDHLSLHGEHPKPTQLDLKTGDGMWRLEVAVFMNGQQLALDLSTLAGKRVRLRAQSITFGVTTFHWLRLDDDQGLRLMLDHRLPDVDFLPELALAVGDRLATLRNDCSDVAIHTLELAGQSRAVLEPGQEGALRLRDRDYRAWNLDTSLIAGNERCTCLVHHVAWMLLRAH